MQPHVGEIYNYRLMVAGIIVKILEIRDDKVLAVPVKHNCAPEWLEIKYLGDMVKEE